VALVSPSSARRILRASATVRQTQVTVCRHHIHLLLYPGLYQRV
jgi:hypothetical protein